MDQKTLARQASLVLVGAVVMLAFQLASAFNLAFFDLPAYVQTVHVLGVIMLTGAVWLLLLPIVERARTRSGHPISAEDHVARTARVLRAALLALTVGVHLGVHSAIRLMTGSGPLSAFVVFASLAGSLHWMSRTTRGLPTEALSGHPHPAQIDTEARIRRLEEDLGWHHQHAADHGCPWGHPHPAA